MSIFSKRRFRDAKSGNYVSEEHAKANPATTVAEKNEDFEYGWVIQPVDTFQFPFEVFKEKEVAEAVTRTSQREMIVRKIKYRFV